MGVMWMDRPFNTLQHVAAHGFQLEEGQPGSQAQHTERDGQ